MYQKTCLKNCSFAKSLFSLAKQNLGSEIKAICERNKGQQQMLLREDDRENNKWIGNKVKHKCLLPLQQLPATMIPTTVTTCRLFCHSPTPTSCFQIKSQQVTASQQVLFRVQEAREKEKKVQLYLNIQNKATAIPQAVRTVTVGSRTRTLQGH